MNRSCRWLLARLLLATIAAIPALSGCIPVLATGAATTAIAAGDRRSFGAQIDDQNIQIRGNARVKQVLPGNPDAYAYVGAFNRRVLLTGLAPDDAAKQRAERAVASVDNVRAVYNELQVGAPRPGASSAQDTKITAQVRAALLQEKDLESGAVRATTEAGVVYLLGLVTRGEGEHASRVVSKVSGVQRVVTFWEYLSDEQLAAIRAERAAGTQQATMPQTGQ